MDESYLATPTNLGKASGALEKRSGREGETFGIREYLEAKTVKTVI
jgi:hypothetical protein